MKRVYDFDKLDKISEALEMDLYRDNYNGGYKDRLSSKDPIEMDSYFEWEIIKMLDDLSDDVVQDFLCTIKCVIIKGMVLEHFNNNTVKSSELLHDEYQVEFAEVIYKSDDEQEVRNEFSKYYCDATIERTQTKYAVEIEYYEFQKIVYENGEIVDYDQIVAPFAKEEYTC